MTDQTKRPKPKSDTEVSAPTPPSEKPKGKEVGGRKGPEPTRYGDWERKGICVDF